LENDIRESLLSTAHIVFGNKYSPTGKKYTPIELLNFSPRTLNALINAGVGSTEKLFSLIPSQMYNFRGMGEKSS